jgi:hypothetical protein
MALEWNQQRLFSKQQYYGDTAMPIKGQSDGLGSAVEALIISQG